MGYQTHDIPYTEPAGALLKPQVEPHEIADHDNASGTAQGVDKGVERGREKGEMAIGRASEKVTAARGPGEGTTDQATDGTSLAAPTSSPNDEDTAAKGPGKGPMDQTADGMSLATPPDSTVDVQDGTQTQRCTNGTCTGQQHDASVHGEGHCVRAQPPNGIIDDLGRHVNNLGRHVDNLGRHVDDLGRCIDDLGRHVEPSTSARPPSTPLEGE
ncbi:hypothetical protein BU15DRAFT_75545 [Melanogaster broomeanus]|nr:hypothetical protein BU15DRAFT_75545 [Melanogaster broomeanus]